MIVHGATAVGGGLESVLELAPGRLHRIGGAIPLDGRVSWYPAGLRGVTPSSCYLFTAGDAALVLDPGLSVHRALVLRRLRELLPAGVRLSVAVSRPELECLSNVGAVVDAFPVERVYGRLPMHQYIGFDARYPALPEEADTTWDVGALEWPVLPVGGVLEVDPLAPGALELEVILAPLWLVSGTWVHDAGSGVLLTGDAFTWVVRRDAGEPVAVCEGDPDPTTVDDVHANLLARFEWLRHADIPRIRAGVAEALGSRAPEVIAPAAGCLLVGRSVVERHVELLDAALARFAG